MAYETVSSPTAWFLQPETWNIGTIPNPFLRTAPRPRPVAHPYAFFSVLHI